MQLLHERFHAIALGDVGRVLLAKQAQRTGASRNWSEEPVAALENVKAEAAIHGRIGEDNAFLTINLEQIIQRQLSQMEEILARTADMGYFSPVEVVIMSGYSLEPPNL